MTDAETDLTRPEPRLGMVVAGPTDAEPESTPPDGVLDSVGVGPWPGPWPADPRFDRVAELLRSVQSSGAMSVRVLPGKAGERGTVLVLRGGNIAPEVDAQIKELGTLLGLEPARGEYRVAYGSVNVNGQEIAILTRSLLHVIGTMASRAELPAADVAQGRASRGLPPRRTAAGERAPFIRCSSRPPRGDAAFASVSYRGHWFWIDDRDLLAKREFAFIMLLFTLADTGRDPDRPVITIPAQ